jgi:hypothetical protein
VRARGAGLRRAGELGRRPQQAGSRVAAARLVRQRAESAGGARAGGQSSGGAGAKAGAEHALEQEQVQGEQKWLRHGAVRQRDGARRS